MNYPLLSILITKIYMIYNSNFIYKWQLSDQAVVPLAWRQFARHIQSDIDTRRISDAPMPPAKALVVLSVRHTHISKSRGHQTSKHWGGRWDSIVGICVNKRFGMIAGCSCGLAGIGLPRGQVRT